MFVELLVFKALPNANYLNKAPIWIGVFSVVVSFFLLVSSNLFLQQGESNGKHKMLGLLFRATQWISFLSGLAIVLRYLGFGQVEYWLSYLVFALVMMIFAETGVQGILRGLDSTDRYEPELDLPLLSAVLSGGNPVSRLLALLEESMGISLRSTWTIQYVRKNLLLIGLILSCFLWGMTSLVQINPDEQGILYSLGRVKGRQAMLPGIHLKLPWPFEMVVVYPYYKVQNFTVGYEADKQSDYLWTKKHSGEEYKLLLGDGKELVSVNMQVFYKISDIYTYALQYNEPEEKLKAEAYRILLNETVTTNLDNLLSRDRSSFATLIANKLQESSQNQKLGLEVMYVALISIHPPTDIAREYQEIVSAGIQKQNIITQAKSYAGSSIPKAEKAKDETVKAAQIEAINRKGEAFSESDTYSYQKRAYQANPLAYREWKWLEMLENALKEKTLYLLDKGLDVQKGSIWLDMRQRGNEKGKEENKSFLEDEAYNLKEEVIDNE